MITDIMRTQVIELYTAYFNRAVDTAGVNYWLNEMDNNGWSISDVAQSFSQQTEYTNLYAGLSNAQVVSKVYTNVLNRTADEAGAAYWESELTNDNISVNQLVQAVITAATEKDTNGNYKNSDDAELFNNKIEISEYYYNKNINSTDVSLSDITKEDFTMESLKANADNTIFIESLFEKYPNSIGKTEESVRYWVSNLNNGDSTYESAEEYFNYIEQLNDSSIADTVNIYNDVYDLVEHSLKLFYRYNYEGAETHLLNLDIDSARDVNGNDTATIFLDNGGFFAINDDTDNIIRSTTSGDTTYDWEFLLMGKENSYTSYYTLIAGSIDDEGNFQGVFEKSTSAENALLNLYDNYDGVVIGDLFGI